MSQTSAKFYESAKNASRRRYGPSAMDLLEEAARDNAATITRCAFCPRWSHRGTAESGRIAATAHREKAHPEIKVTRRRRGRKKKGVEWYD